MRSRASVRWGIALLGVFAVYRLTFPSLLEIGARAGVWGIGGVLILSGFGLALVFSAIYDGPRAMIRLLRPVRSQSAGTTTRLRGSPRR